MNEQMKNKWIEIICKMYKGIHNSDRVMHVSKESENKTTRMLNYFNRLEEIHKKVSEMKNKNAELLLKSFYYKLYVIKPEDIKESYFQSQINFARERGMGDIALTEQDREIMTKQIIEDQKASLDKWIEYFLYDDESRSYEMWEKYWVFQGLQNLGKYDKESGKFSKRDKTTVYPFPPVERECIFTTLHLMENYIKNKNGEDEIRSALGNGNFKQLYEYALNQRMLKKENKKAITEGKWVKYEQGSDYTILRNSLQGYYTGWCTAAGENFARDQLADGDFYVYYSLDENSEAKVPRIAIRMDGKDTIEEVRGVKEDQNMEPEMLPVLEKKLEEFPDRDNYLKKVHDMSLLALLAKKAKNNVELTLEDLMFLYEIDDSIKCFGYEKDSRISEIKAKRDIIKDYNLIFTNVKHCNNDLCLNYLRSSEGLVLPESIGGSLYLNWLRSAEGLVMPKIIEGNLILYRLTSAKGLVFPKIIGGDLYLYSLISPKGLVLPESIGGGLYLNGLVSAKNLVLPESIEGDLSLNSITSAKCLVLPESIGGVLRLDSLTSAEGLMLPYDFNLDSLWCDENIKIEIRNNPDKYFKKAPVCEKKYNSRMMK